MREISSNAQLIEGQPMFKVIDKVKRLEAQGKHIIHLEIGDPDFDTPRNIVNAAKSALDAGQTHYVSSWGMSDFVEVLISATNSSRGFKPDINQVLVTPGANIAIFYAVFCLCNSGQEVLVPDPGFPTYLSAIKMCGAKPAPYPLHEKNGFRMRAADIEPLITKKTRLLIINSPQNPTGAITEPWALKEIYDLAVKHDLYIYSDEIYARMVYGEQEFFSIASLDRCQERVILSNGFSKAFAMTGWRLGALVMPAILAERMMLLLQTTSSCVAPFLQVAGIEAVKGNQKAVNTMMMEYKHRRDILVSGLNAIPGITCHMPGGAFYAFPNISSFGMSSEEFADYMLDNAGIALLPGSCFGQQGEGFVRLVYASSRDNISRGIETPKNRLSKSIMIENKMIRVADYIAQFISDELGIRDVFMLTGAGSMHLTDGVACNSKLRAICVHHEQSASMALEAYARANENFAVGYFSTGPAATNALTGLGGAWQDSVPCLFISGQVKRSETQYAVEIEGMRQFGVQELNIIPVVKSLCKEVVHLTDPRMVRFELERLVAIAKKGRPGPVWLEVPMDVQAASIDPDDLPLFKDSTNTPKATNAEISSVVRLLARAKRPVIIAGRGVRISGAQHILQELATRYSIPVVTPYLGIDNLPHNLDIYIGKTGVKGDRAANFTMQNSDLVLSIGSSLHVSVIGYDYTHFARAANKVVVDIDLSSHRKKTIAIDHLIQADAKDFMNSLFEGLNLEVDVVDHRSWLEKCVSWKEKYPVCLPEYAQTKGAINIYSFVDRLSDLSQAGDFFISDAGSAFYAVSQGINLSKPGQRYIPSSAMATMGYSLPASIGVSSAIGDKRVLAVTGDGSFQQNIQELQTLLHYQLPVKLFVLNNDGYLSIRASQKNYFKERYIGEGPRSGVTMPDTVKICEAYGVPCARVSSLDDLDDAIKLAFETPGPYVLDVITPSEQLIIPTVSSKVNADGSMSSRPLEDMAPFLERDEYRGNLYIDEI